MEVRGCTAFAFTDKNKVFYGRDNDLPPYLKNYSKTIYYSAIGKNKFILNTSSFTNGEEGVNEHGLVVAMTFVAPHKIEVQPGLNSVFLVRYILENCATISEGIKVLKNVPIASSCNIILVDKSMKMIVAECNPIDLNLRYPDTNAKYENFLVTVNHFTSKKMRKHDRSQQNVYSSKIRYETAYNAIKNADYNNPISFAKNILRGKYGFMCQYQGVKFENIWSTIFDLTSSKMFIAHGNPAFCRYQEKNISFI